MNDLRRCAQWLMAGFGLVALAGIAQAREFTVLTYNVENLFDIDGIAIYDDYKQDAPNRAWPYSPEMLRHKVEHVATVLRAAVPGGPDIVILNELEEDRTPESTVTDLAAELARVADISLAELLSPAHVDEFRGHPIEFFLFKALAEAGLNDYHLAQATWPNGDLSQASVHKNAVLSRFPFRSVRWTPLEQARAIVEADIDIDGASFVVLANHWKSGASNAATELTRRGNAEALRARIDALLAEDPKRDILLGGDFNAAYHQEMLLPDYHPNAINHILGSQGDEQAVAEGRQILYNLWFERPVGQRFSDQYRGYWGTLMQNMITPGLYDRHGVRYIRGSFGPVVIPGVTSQGPLNLPRRWKFYGGGRGGSDHFPILARFEVVTAADSDATAADSPPRLTNPGRQETAELAPVAVAWERVNIETIPPAQQLNDHTDSELTERFGEVYRVIGKVVRTRPFQVQVGDRTYDVWSYDDEVVQVLQRWVVGRTVRFAGELDEFRGRLQFVVHRAEWVNLPARSGD